MKKADTALLLYTGTDADGKEFEASAVIGKPVDGTWKDAIMDFEKVQSNKGTFIRFTGFFKLDSAIDIPDDIKAVVKRREAGEPGKKAKEIGLDDWFRKKE